MRVSPSSRRRSRAPHIWLFVMIACGLIALAAVTLAREASRGFGNTTTDSRVNILVLGIDQREGMTDPARTDTMLLFTFDRQLDTAGMLSINRDLWVKIPGGQREGKINTAHFLGEVERVPGGGPALAMQTVQAALDVPVQYYIRLNFSAFEQLIDLIGGIDLNVVETIDDPDYPDTGFGYEPFHINAGWQHLDGRTALKYARTRATPGSDLDRVKRQQQVILAVRDKLLSEKRLPQLLARIGSLLSIYSGSIQTNLTPGQLQELIEFAAGIDRNKIYAVTFDEQSIEEFFTPDGQDAIILKPGAAQHIREQLYNQPSALTPHAPASNSPILIAPTIPLSMTATSAPALTSTASTPQRYIVQQDDTLFSLARRYGVSVADLQRVNNLTDDNIYVGQQLIIPTP
jgi:polyisoprenyl-teichoic acid--peptidoglycan teichoic acid transferase